MGCAASCSLKWSGCARRTTEKRSLIDGPDVASDEPELLPSDTATDESADSGMASDCVVEVGAVEDGWVEIELADYPELEAPGGHATIAVPSALLYVIVACVSPECWVALWSTCTHGACGLEWRPEPQHAFCPCHGSVFDRNGVVQNGPAVRDLAVFPVGRRGDSLWVHRPL